MTGLAGLVLAAGRGSRLRPLTDTTPKPLVDVGGTTLLDLALARLGTVLPLDPQHVAVNAHWLAGAIREHVDDQVHLSVEEPEALGTAGAVGQLREWLDGRDVMVTNSDAWYHPVPDLGPFVADWDGRRPRLLVVADEQRPDFEGGWRFAGTSLLPWEAARELAPVPSGLYELVWSQTPVELVPTDVTFVDCGTPDDLALVRRLVTRHEG